MYTYTGYQYPKNGTAGAYGGRDDGYKRSGREKRGINLPALAGSVAGTLLPMMILAKRQKTNLFKINYEFKEMMLVGTGAIVGGLAGGIIGDRNERTGKKIKEANFQFLTNLLIPTFLVDRLLKIVDKKIPKTVSKTKNALAKAAAVIVGVGGGMKIGEFFTNKMHRCFEKHREKERKLQPQDALLHIDDLPVALTLSKVPHVDKVLPFTFVYSGYQAGKK
mgnify:CR=1 FL=1